MNDCSLIIFAADHGIVDEGVSAYPQIVTREMVLNFLRGGAAANVFASVVGVSVSVVDAGVAGDPINDALLVSRNIAPATKNFANGPAMSNEQRDQALASGRQLGVNALGEAICFGEMGIGNTSSATMITHKLTGRSLDDLTGRGTGLDAVGVPPNSQFCSARPNGRLQHSMPNDAQRVWRL